MKTLILLCLLLPAFARSEEVRLSVGMKHEEAISLIQKHGGIDITSNLAIVAPKNGLPPKNIFWAFKDYDAVVSLSETDGKLAGMSYWNKEDFDKSKSHRAKTEQKIGALKLDTKTKRASIEPSHPKGTPEAHPTQSSVLA